MPFQLVRLGKPFARQVPARLALAVIAVCLALGFVSPSPAQVADDALAGGVSYITPFPPGDVYKLQVYGDGYSEGLLQGLTDSAKSLERVELPKKHRLINTLTRLEAEDEIKAEEQSRDALHIAIVMLGLNDRASFRSATGNSVKCCGPQWKELYAQRLDRLLKVLKKRNMAVYVVGMPPLRRQDANADAETINEALLERAQGNGIRFIEIAESFADENGAFSQFLPDVAGNREKLRDGDGIGFTSAGNRKLASLVVNELKRDITAARAERAVPLAGAEADQRRINPEKAAAAAWKSTVVKDGKDLRPAPAAAAAAATGASPALAVVRAAAGQSDQKSETGRVTLKFTGANGREETAAIDIVRPAIPAAVIALLARKETAESGQQRFEMLAEDVGGGVSVSTMVAALPEAGGAAGRRKGGGNLANYNAVWVKGERLPSKPGRADDFSWPRTDAVLLPEPAPVAAAAPRGSPRSAGPDAQSPRGRPASGQPRG
jgi:uncharacterized protein